MGKGNLEYVVQAIQVLENLVLARLTGLQKLDFPPFPVFLKLSHTAELRLGRFLIDNLSVRKQKLIFQCQWPSKPDKFELRNWD